MDHILLDSEWLEGYPKPDGQFIAVSLEDDQQNGKLFNVDDSVTIHSFICERVSGSQGTTKNP